MFYYATSVKEPTKNPHTILQVYAPADQEVKIHGAELNLRGSTPATSSIPFDWIIQTSAGVGTTLTTQMQDRGLSIAPRATITADFTTEPTAGSILIELGFHQQATAFWRAPFPIIVTGEERVALRYKGGEYVSVGFTVFLEE